MEKEAITPEVVSRLVAAQFPEWARLPVTPVELDGWDNTTFRLGEDLTVRLPSADGYVPQIEKEHRWLPVLAQQLPLPIPQPLAKGTPGSGFPRPWSVYRWLPGRHATIDRVEDPTAFANDLADFLAALYEIRPAAGPEPGAHSFFRGGPLTTYDTETRATIANLCTVIDVDAATTLWEAALATTWQGAGVWIHGDVTAANLLVIDGRLSAIIDFGCSAVGDPACDLTVAWTFFFGEARDAFRNRLALDKDTWIRARGWALWKALITLEKGTRAGDVEGAIDSRRFGWRLSARRVIEELLGP
ncbi:MAG: aminoglycoside phosphotransferase family protein [Actinobacteria bacterium]|nr:aminoglycoside phosphotransferase family protein [Actinomycetota bacterium]